ncbi:MAG: phytanoyl-CoA dioxygenase family protein [Caldilineaceae bacterium]
MLTEQQIDQFNTFGFLILPQWFNLAEVATIEQECEQGFAAAYPDKPFDGSKRYWTTLMGPGTPLTRGLLEDERFYRAAQQLYGEDVLGIMTDANRYVGHTRWHPDNDANPAKDPYGVKFAYYLDPVDAQSGALRVVPGSHKYPLHQEVGDTIKRSGLDILDVPSYVCRSQPGDVVAFDLRLWHASWGGSAGRRMCTVVYLHNPTTAQEETGLRDFASRFVTTNRYFDRPNEPMYHPDWLENREDSALRRRWIQRLGEMGFLAAPSTG